MYLGDYTKNDVVYYQWDTTDPSGNSVDPSTSGTLIIYQNSTLAQTESDIAYTVGFDGITGIHDVQVQTSGAFYTVENDYTMVISGCVVEGKTIQATLARFSVQNRHHSELPANLATVSGNLTTHISDFAVHSGALTVHQSDFAIASGKITVHQSDFAVHSGNLTVHQGDFGAVSGNLTIHMGDFTTASGQINDMAAQVVASGDAATAGTGWGATAASDLTSGIVQYIIDTHDTNIDLTLATVSGSLTTHRGDFAVVSGQITALASEIVTSGNAANWDSSTAIAQTDIDWIASGVWEQNIDNGDFVTSGLAGQKFQTLHKVFLGAAQIVPSGDERWMHIYNNATPTGAPDFSFKLLNYSNGDPTVSLQTITGRDRIST